MMRLRGVGANDVKEVQEIVQHLFTTIVKLARGKRNSQQAATYVDHLLFKLIDDMRSIWDENSFLDRAQVLVKKAIDEHPDYNNAKLQESSSQKRSGDEKTTR